MLLAAGLAGLILLLLVAALSVAYLALPGGRFCPRCGGPTQPVLLRRWIRPLAHVLHWRWCVDCGWEGLGRPPQTPNLGERFRWNRPDPEGSPVFQWREDPGAHGLPDPEPEARPSPPESIPGFRWGSPDQERGPAFHWGGRGRGGRGGEGDAERAGVLARFLRWLRPGDDPGFRWGDPDA